MWGRAPDAQARSFDEVLVAYLTQHTTRTPMSKRKSMARPLSRAFGGRDMASISDVDVRQYVLDRMETVKAATVNKEVGLFAAACSWCREHLGWEIPNPAAGKKRREPEGRVRWITEDEARRLVEASRLRTKAPWLAPYVQLSLYTGMRMGEVVGLTWERVDLHRRVVLLEETKAGKRRAVPLHEKAVEALEERLAYRHQHCPGSPWVFCNAKGRQVKDMKKSFTRARKEAGIENYRRHDQRHTLASWMVMSGVELVRVRDMLGHSTIRMTERYAHLHPEALHEAVAMLGKSRSGHAEEIEEMQPIPQEEGKPLHYH